MHGILRRTSDPKLEVAIPTEKAKKSENDRLRILYMFRKIIFDSWSQWEIAKEMDLPTFELKFVQEFHKGVESATASGERLDIFKAYYYKITITDFAR